MHAEQQMDGRKDTAKRIGNILQLTKMRLETGSFSLLRTIYEGLLRDNLQDSSTIVQLWCILRIVTLTIIFSFLMWF